MVVYSAEVHVNAPKLGFDASELEVCQNGAHLETARCVESDHILDGRNDSVCLSIVKLLDRAELDVPRFGHKEWDFVDVHNVDGQGDIFMLFEDGSRRLIHGGVNSRISACCSLAF